MEQPPGSRTRPSTVTTSTVTTPTVTTPPVTASADTLTDSRPLEALGDEIAELSAQIAAATYRMLVLLREFDERGGWHTGPGPGAFASCAQWLHWRTGIAPAAARERVRVARALGGLPLISAEMERGRLSFSKVRALTRIATAETEEELLHLARAGSAAQVEKVVRGLRRLTGQAERQRDERRREGRSLQTRFDDDGMLVVEARLEPEVGAVLMKALDAAVDREYDRESEARRDGDAGEPEGDDTETSTVAQRRADAVGVIAEAAMRHDLDPGTRGDRYQVVVHVDEAVLAERDATERASPALEGRTAEDTAEDRLAEDSPAEGSPVEEDADKALGCFRGSAQRASPLESSQRLGECRLQDGPDLSQDTVRRLTCDGSRVTMRHGRGRGIDASVLDVGRRTRAVPSALRRALERRDRGCAFPGCCSRFAEAHHIHHWAAGGETRLGNLVLLCRRHHRAVHEGGFEVELVETEGGVEARFRSPGGRELAAAPRQPEVDASAFDDWRAGHRGAGIGPRSLDLRGDSGRLDLGYALQVYAPLVLDGFRPEA